MQISLLFFPYCPNFIWVCKSKVIRFFWRRIAFKKPGRLVSDDVHTVAPWLLLTDLHQQQPDEHSPATVCTCHEQIIKQRDPEHDNMTAAPPKQEVRCYFGDCVSLCGLSVFSCDHLAAVRLPCFVFSLFVLLFGSLHLIFQLPFSSFSRVFVFVFCFLVILHCLGFFCVCVCVLLCLRCVFPSVCICLFYNFWSFYSFWVLLAKLHLSWIFVFVALHLF